MNDPVHLPVDLLADHHEGLVTGAQAADVVAHLNSCADCRSLVAALDEVGAVLRAEGSHGLTMPTSVASSLDQALERVAAERPNGIPSLAQRRADDVADASQGQRRQAWPLLAAAATVVIATAVGVGVVLEDNVGPADSSQAGAGSADDQRSDGAGESAPSNADTAPKSPDALPGPGRRSTAELRELARELDSGAKAAVGPQRSCATPTKRYGAGPASLVVFDGSPAVAVLDVKARTVTIVDCASARTRLFATDY